MGWAVKVERVNDWACVSTSDVGATVAVGAGIATAVERRDAVDDCRSNSIVGNMVVKSAAGGGARRGKLHGTLCRE